MFVTDIPFGRRIQSAHRYFDYLWSTKEKSWFEKFEEIEASDRFGIPEVLTLLSPDHYLELGMDDPRGPRSFSGTSNFSHCRSIEIWGYPCPFENQRIQVDHLFPQSKGGMTHHTNAMHLCEMHNKTKFIDIHLIPWETFLTNQEWIVMTLNKFLESAMRIRKTKIYVPLKQLTRL